MKTIFKCFWLHYINTGANDLTTRDFFIGPTAHLLVNSNLIGRYFDL